MVPQTKRDGGVVLGESPNKKAKLGGIMVGDRLTTDEELQEFLCSSLESRFSAKPHELALALKTHDVIMHIYPDVQAALSAANGRPIQEENPLKIGEDAWSQPWHSETGIDAIEHGERHMWQCAHNFFALNILDIEDAPCPELNNVELQQLYFFNEPTPILEVLTGIMSTELMRSGGRVVKKRAKPGEDPPAMNDRDGNFLFETALPGIIMQVGGHVHTWAFVLGMYKWLKAGKCMKKWLNPVRSVVICAHHPGSNDHGAASLDRLGKVIDAGEALTKRSETESIPATDKAALIHKVRISITKSKNGRKATTPEVSVWLSKRKWSSKATLESERTIGALNKIQQFINEDSDVLDIVRQIDYMAGSGFINGDVWKQDAVLNCLPILDSKRLQMFYWTLFISLVRGDIANAGSLSVASLRTNKGSLGTVGLLGWRMEIRAQLFQMFDFCEDICCVFRDMRSFDKSYPSTRALDAAVKNGKALQLDQSFVGDLVRYVDIEGEVALRKLMSGGFDSDIKSTYKTSLGKNVTVMTLLKSDELESMIQKLEEAKTKDAAASGAVADVVTMVIDGGDGGAGSGSSHAGLDQSTDLGVVEVEDPNDKARADILRKAMVVRGGKVTVAELLASGDRQAISAAAESLEKKKKKEFGKAMTVRYFCADSCVEKELRPWAGPEKLQGSDLLRAETSLGDCVKGDVAIACSGGHFKNSQLLHDAAGKKVEIQLGDKTVTIASMRTTDQWLIFNDAKGYGCRRRGVAQGQNVEHTQLATHHTSKAPAAFKKTQRLNGSGTSHSSSILNLERQHHRVMPQLKQEDKVKILAHCRAVDVSSLGPEDALPGEKKRHQKLRQCVRGSLPLNWRAKDVTTIRELLNLIPNIQHCQVIDYSTVPTGEVGVAALSLGATYAFFALNPSHKSFVLKSIDMRLVEWMGKKGPLYQGDSIAPMLEKLFPVVKPPQEQEDGSTSSEGDE